MVFSEIIRPFRMDLQLFGEPAAAEGAGEPQATAGGQGAEPSRQPGEGEQRYTLEEVQKLIQSETDKRITQAQKKWQKEHERVTMGTVLFVTFCLCLSTS